MSKQLKYYYRHKPQILAKKRVKYHNSKLASKQYENKQDKPEVKTKSINIFLREPFILNEGKEAQNKLFLHRNMVFESRHPQKSKRPICTQKCKIREGRKRVTRNMVYQAILLAIIPHRWLYLNELSSEIKEPRRTLIYHLNELIRTKWLIKVKGQKYMLNPLLQFLIENDFSSSYILDYACYKIDLFRLLCYPLRTIKNPVEFEAKVYWQKNPDGSRTEEVLPNNPKLWSVFHGILYIRAKMENGLEVQTFLPINAHYDYLKTRRMKKRVVNPHFCVPCDWRLFNVKESTYYSGFSEEANRSVKVHFDNSITIMYFPDYMCYWMFKQPYENAVEKWNGSEFIECTNENTLEKLFTLRFKEGLSRTELFEKMQLTIKRLGRH